MAKFSKKLAVSNFENIIFENGASCHCCSVISKLYFQKYHTVFEIFVNFVIQKFLRIATVAKHFNHQLQCNQNLV